jgi:hydrogenase nickel incorporation protein HypA/HybF
MHEMSIVEALLDAVRRETQAYPAAQVATVRVRVGALRQVVPETLVFCYEAATRDTPLAPSRLEIEAVPAEARCWQCSLTFAVDESWFECPRCKALGADLFQGAELELLTLELNQEE